MKRALSILMALCLNSLAVSTALGQPTPSAAIDAMPGLVLRMKASTLGLADGAPVLVWPNSADVTRSAAAAGGAPVYRANTVNGKGVVRFARSNYDRLDIAAGGIALDDWTVFVVHRTSGDCCFLTHSLDNLQLRVGEAGENRLTGWDSTQGAAGSLQAVPRTDWAVAEYRRGGPLLAFQENGTYRGHGPWTGTATFDQIGAITGSPSLDGDIAEIVIFSRKLTVKEEVKVYDYFSGEYAIVPTIVPTAVVHAPPALPRLYSSLHYEAAAGIDFRDLPIDRTNVYMFPEPLVNPNLLTFQWAVDWLIPNVNATGHASLDLEIAHPGLLPLVSRDYAGDAWNTTDREYIISLLTYARAARPGVKWGVYWQPYYDSYALRSPLYAYYASNAEWVDAFTRPGALREVLAYCDFLQPEVYPHDLTETQADSTYVAAANVQLCHDVNDYYVMPQVARETLPMIWVQVVPTHFGPGEEGDFLTLADLTQRLIAVRLSGADGVFLGGDGAPRFHTPAQWQQWADTTLTQALTLSGFLCYANCDGSTAPPVLNINDFGCFLNRFASGDPLANCDGSTSAPTLNVLDFTCFLNRFAAGCP